MHLKRNLHSASLRYCFIAVAVHCLPRAESNRLRLPSCNVELADQSELCTQIPRTVAWTGRYTKGMSYWHFACISYAKISTPALAFEDERLMSVVAVDILIWLMITWEQNNIIHPTEQSSDSNYFYLYENQMSQQPVLNDAHFPLWFTTLENVVEESRHCLSHSAALSHNLCNRAAAAGIFFTGVKCNRPLGYIYLS